MARGVRGLERPPVWAAIAMVLGLVGLGVGLLFGADRGGEPLSRAELDRLTAAASAADASDAAVAAEAARIAALRVAFLGDSYSAGVGAGPGLGYVDLVLARERWSADGVFAQGGTGYTNPGQEADNEATFLGRVPDVVAFAPDVVVVQGSTNDADPDGTRAAATEVYRRLTASLPDAVIVVVGPPNNPAASTTTAVRDAVASAAEAGGVTFIDAWDWLDVGAPSLWAEDGVHPSGAGHRVLADRVFAALGDSGALDPA